MLNRKEYMKQYYIENHEKILKQKKWYRENNREKIRERNKQYSKNTSKLKKRQNLKRNYNLSYKDWLKMREAQDGKCAICGKFFIKPSDAHTDHNHKTGKVRGLLCMKCNRGIGYLNDDPEILIKATEYLFGQVI